jgi:hypothetical protein
MIILIQQQLILLYITWYNTPYALWLLINNQYEQCLRPWTRRPPARYWRTPYRCAYRRERLGGRHTTIQDYEFRVIILFFFCFAICVTRYPYPKTQSRENAHRMYPRYPRVFLYVIIYCPLPHQSLWERLGVSLSWPCAAFRPLC